MKFLAIVLIALSGCTVKGELVNQCQTKCEKNDGLHSIDADFCKCKNGATFYH